MHMRARRMCRRDVSISTIENIAINTSTVNEREIRAFVHPHNHEGANILQT